jgi:hypothetical protein
MPFNVVECIVYFDQVSLASSKQLGSYKVWILEAGDCVTQVTSKLVGGNFIITTLICIYKFRYLFPLQGFVKDILLQKKTKPCSVLSQWVDCLVCFWQFDEGFGGGTYGQSVQVVLHLD